MSKGGFRPTEEIKVMHYCLICNKYVSRQWKFCPECGNKIRWDIERGEKPNAV